MVTASSPRLLANALVNQVRRFRRDEDGALIIFALVLFFLMALMGGVAIDLMKHEGTRTALQNTLDRCTLMAASLDQRLDPQSVVVDCVGKAGFGDELEGVQVVQSMNSRDVKTKARSSTDPYFLHLIGINSFDAKGSSGAAQEITNVEISLVLDVSGSMSGAKIANLRSAAAEFVDTMLLNDPNHRVSISVVPYNAQVNLGETLRSKYQATKLHGVTDVNCVELPNSVFATPGIPRNVDLPMMAYADYAYGTNTANAYLDPSNPSFSRPNHSANFCRKVPANIVRLPSQDAATLKAQINGLQAGGNTSITLGMKWGMAMIDPGTRSAFNELEADGQMGANLAGRPFNYEDPEAMKVIVLMTDGEHVAHNRINDAYKAGPSPIYRSTGDGMYSIFHAGQPGANKYWVPHLSAWQATAYNSGAGAPQQNWETVWSDLKLSYVAWQFYGRALGTSNATRTAAYNAAMNTMQSTYASAGTMDTTLQQSCALAKANDVIVYGIAFQAPANGQAQISQCASSPSHYFNANGLEIGTAFRTIASNLTQLKLTQ